MIPKLWTSSLGVALFLTLATVASAQDPDLLTIEDAVSEAMTHNYDVLRARERLDNLEGQIVEVRSEVLPQLGLESSYVRDYNEAILDSLEGFISPQVTNHYAVRATASQLLFSWGKARTAVEIAKVSREQGTEDVLSVERDVKLLVHDAFYQVLLTQRLVQVAEERLAQRERQLDVARKRFEAGVVNEFEVIRAEVDVANAKTPVIQTHNAVRQAKDRLNLLMARPTGSPIEAAGELQFVPLADTTLETVLDRAIAQRPELAALRLGREIAEKSLKIARAENKPEINLEADYGFASEYLDHLDPSREVWSAGVFFRMPFFDGGRTRGLVIQAESQMRDVDIATEQLREDIALEAKAALDDLEEAQDIIDASSLNIGQAQKALELAETSYQYGVATFLDVTDAQLGLTVAQIDHARALKDYMLARARVLSVMNEL